jgi:hypothetical protein
VVSNMAQTLRKMYDNARMEGKTEGLLAGEAKGKVEGKLEMARNFLLMGMDIETVAKAASGRSHRPNPFGSTSGKFIATFISCLKFFCHDPLSDIGLHLSSGNAEVYAANTVCHYQPIQS